MIFTTTLFVTLAPFLIAHKFTLISRRVIALLTIGTWKERFIEKQTEKNAYKTVGQNIEVCFGFFASCEGSIERFHTEHVLKGNGINVCDCPLLPYGLTNRRKQSSFARK